VEQERHVDRRKNRKRCVRLWKKPQGILMAWKLFKCLDRGGEYRNLHK
jgi:hypothetical protein